jgi:lipoate-protein ligase A
MIQESVWRFINSGAAEGAFNMAADEALACSLKSSQPVVRVYRWQPYTISIGYNQDFSDLDLTKCREDGIGLVRRPTGGRAILHAHEVTYSVIFPRESDRYGKNTLDLYNQISSAICEGLNSNGLPVVLEKKEEAGGAKHHQHRFACFSTSAKYEIHYDSKKLVGSAQRRFKSAVLQHGSILLGDEHLHILDYLSPAANGKTEQLRKQLRENTISMQTILNRTVAYNEMVESIKTGFEHYFKVRLEERKFSDAELRRINELKIKYQN